MPLTLPGPAALSAKGLPSAAVSPATSQPLAPVRLITKTFPLLADAKGSVIVFAMPPGLEQKIV